MHRHRKPPTTKKQEGIILMASLILLGIVTVLGVTSTRDVSLQTAMSTNSQIGLETFDAALSEIRAQIANMRVDNTNLQNLLGNSNIENIDTESKLGSEYKDLQSKRGMISSVTLRYTGKGALTSGFSADSFTAQGFELTSTVTMSGVATGSTQIQGVNYAAPK